MVTIDPYESKVLKRDVHARLVADIDHIAQDANIEREWIWRPLAGAVTSAEVEWVRRYKHHKPNGTYGLCMSGKPHIDPTTRMSAIAGALTRNFIRARVQSVGQVIDAYEKGSHDGPSCLLVPNFFLGKHQGSSIPAWKLTHLIDMLVERRLAGQQTVIYVSDLNAMSEEYGIGFTQHAKSYFTMINA